MFFQTWRDFVNTVFLFKLHCHFKLHYCYFRKRAIEAQQRRAKSPRCFLQKSATLVKVCNFVRKLLKRKRNRSGRLQEKSSQRKRYRTTQPLMAVLLTHHYSGSGRGAKNSTQSQITMYDIKSNYNFAGGSWKRRKKRKICYLIAKTC